MNTKEEILIILNKLLEERSDLSYMIYAIENNELDNIVLEKIHKILTSTISDIKKGKEHKKIININNRIKQIRQLEKNKKIGDMVDLDNLLKNI